VIIGEAVQIDLSTALALGGVLSATLILIRIGDRLWGNRNGGSTTALNGVRSKLAETDMKMEHMNQSYDRMNDSLQRLSDEIVKLTELQQTSLKLAEYHYNSIDRKLDVVADRLRDHSRR